MIETLPTAVRRGPPPRPLADALPLVIRGLRGTAHVALDLLVGMVALVVVVSLVAVGAGLGPLLLVGLPVLWVALALARVLARAERARLDAVLDVVVAAPARHPAAPRTGAWTRLTWFLRDGASWRAVLWAVWLGVAGPVWAVLVLGLWSAGLAALTAPLWTDRAPAGGWLRTEVPLLPLTAVLLGLVAVAAALAAATGAAAADAALARRLLGPSRRARTAVLEERVDELTETRRAAVEAADAERRRIERDLHDGAQQRLVALAMDLGLASARFEDDPVRARELVVKAHGEAKQALAELRDLARGIHPAVLTDRGLDAALSALAARSPVPVTVDARVLRRCSPTVEATAYFVVSEALTNAAKHAGASRVSVVVRRAADAGAPLTLTVLDDGRGGADPRAGTGLLGLQRRVAGADGTVELSSPAGGPTLLTAELPCAS